MQGGTKEQKVAIVTSGGGMRCAYAAGALVALARDLGYGKPDIFISASGSVGAMFYYLAGQYEDIERAWLRYVPSREIVSAFPPRLRVDYVVDTILKRDLPLDENTLRATTTRWFVPMTNLDTGKTEYVTSEQWFDPYEVMRAAKAIPFLYGGAVRLGAKPYIDGDVSVDIAELIKKARHEGATKVLVIANIEKSSSAMRLFTLISAAFARPMVRYLVLSDGRRGEWDDLPADVEILVVGPTYPLPLGTLTRIRRKILQAYQMGRDDLLAKRAQIAKLLA
jgi:predicted patatin/cPLA2 family phospholipase